MALSLKTVNTSFSTGFLTNALSRLLCSVLCNASFSLSSLAFFLTWCLTMRSLDGLGLECSQRKRCNWGQFGLFALLLLLLKKWPFSHTSASLHQTDKLERREGGKKETQERRNSFGVTRSSAMHSTHAGWKWLDFECLGQANTHLLAVSYPPNQPASCVCFSKL